MYQALALKLGINEVTEEDILNCYSIEEDRIQEIMNRYWEKIAYKNVLEEKVKTSIQEKIKWNMSKALNWALDIYYNRRKIWKI